MSKKYTAVGYTPDGGKIDFPDGGYHDTMELAVRRVVDTALREYSVGDYRTMWSDNNHLVFPVRPARATDAAITKASDSIALMKVVVYTDVRDDDNYISKTVIEWLPGFTAYYAKPDDVLVYELITHDASVLVAAVAIPELGIAHLLTCCDTVEKIKNLGNVAQLHLRITTTNLKLVISGVETIRLKLEINLTQTRGSKDG